MRVKQKTEHIDMHDYPEEYHLLIQESSYFLRTKEQMLRGTKLVDRVRMLRLLKEQLVPSLAACGRLLGYCYRQIATWWKSYRQGGLDQLLTLSHRRGGRPPRLSSAVKADLMDRVRAGSLCSLEDVQYYLRMQYKCEYQLATLKEMFLRENVQLPYRPLHAAFSSGSPPRSDCSDILIPLPLLC